VAALNAGDAEEAVSLGEELLRRRPDSEYAERTRVVVGEAWFQRGDMARAEQALAGLETSASDPALRARAASRVAWCHYQRGDHAGAAERFARLAAESPAAPEAEEARAMEGRARDDGGDPAGAVRAWRAYLKDFPGGASRPAVLAGLARRDELPAALQAAQALIRESPESELAPQALFDVAERASEAGDRATAESLYRAVLEGARRGQPASAAALAAPARYGLAWCLVQDQSWAEAARELDALRNDPSASEELRASGLELAVWACGKSGEPRKAADAWRAFAERCTDETRLFEAAKTAALALKESGAPKEASDLMHEVLERVRTPAVAVLALVEGAYLALDAGDVDRAEAEVAVARRRAPDDPKLAEASFFVAEARFGAGDKEAALPLYRAGAAPGSPVAALSLYKLGFAELEHGDAQAAEAALARLQAEHPQSEVAGEGLFLLGEARMRQGSFEAAAADFERLRRERPRHEVLPKALFRLGQAYAELGRWQECDAALTELLEKSPRFENLAEAELTRGRALAALGRGRAARQALSRVLALDGESVLAARAHLELGRLARSEGDLEAALSEFLKVAVLYAADEEVAEALFLAGECLQDQKKPEAARDRWREAAEEHPNTKHGALARGRLAEPAARGG
jgi:TolA-binding protein